MKYNETRNAVIKKTQEKHKDTAPQIYNQSNEEINLIKNMLSAWDSICIVNNWDNDHLVEFRIAREYVKNM